MKSKGAKGPLSHVKFDKEGRRRDGGVTRASGVFSQSPLRFVVTRAVSIPIPKESQFQFLDLFWHLVKE